MYCGKHVQRFSAFHPCASGAMSCDMVWRGCRSPKEQVVHRLRLKMGWHRMSALSQTTAHLAKMQDDSEPEQTLPAGAGRVCSRICLTLGSPVSYLFILYG